MSDVEEPGLEYLPAEIEQHEMDQLQREYDAGMYRDGDVVPPRIVSTQEICGRSATGTPGMSTRR